MHAPLQLARAKGSLRNYDESGLPSMFKAYNGKPTLIRNREAVKGSSGRLERGPAHLEMNVNVRAWPYLTKQGLGYLLPSIDKCDIDVGFVLEGIADEELPEVALAVRCAPLAPL